MVDKPENDSTRECLLVKAKRLFALKGFRGTSVREVADAAGVNLSLISYHFDGKEGLYRACLERFGKDRLESARRVLQTPKSREEFEVRLTMFVEEFIQAYLADPDRTRLLNREIEMGMAIAEDIFRSTFLKVFETLTAFFTAAQKAEWVDKELDPKVVTSMFMGGMVHFFRNDPLHEKFLGHGLKEEKYRKKVSHHLVRVTLNGISSHEKRS